MSAPPGFAPVASTSTYVEPPPMSEQELSIKARKWAALQSRRYGNDRKTAYVEDARSASR